MTNYLVIGLGISGISVIDFLQNNPSNRIFVYDDYISQEEHQQLQQRYQCYVFCSLLPDNPLFKTLDTIVLSPGVNLERADLVAIREHYPQISWVNDIELFARACPANAKVLAVTGTNGKTTVVHLLQHLLQGLGVHAYLGGNVGVPALQLLAASALDAEPVYILELSSFQLLLIRSLCPTAAVVLNITDDHLDRHGSFAAYQQAKLQIYNNAHALVYNRHDLATVPRVRDIQVAATCVSFALDFPIDQNAFGIIDGYLAVGEQKLMPIPAVPLLGQQNLANVLAVLAVLYAAGYPLVEALPSLSSFAGLPHRCQFVADIAGVRWINDSKGTNVGATVAALTGLGQQCRGKFVLILGGDGKGADFRHLVPLVLQYCRAVLLIGKEQQALYALFAESLPCYCCDTFEACLQQARKLAVAGDYVLLSPACSSLDMFRNFEDRGQQFMDYVAALSS